MAKDIVDYLKHTKRAKLRVIAGNDYADGAEICVHNLLVIGLNRW